MGGPGSGRRPSGRSRTTPSKREHTRYERREIKSMFVFKDKKMRVPTNNAEGRKMARVRNKVKSFKRARDFGKK